MAKKRRFINKINEYPVLQGILTEDAITTTCSTGKLKTSFVVENLINQKKYNCVLWTDLPNLNKGQLIAARGWLKNDVFVCISVHKINVPYKFDMVEYGS